MIRVPRLDEQTRHRRLTELAKMAIDGAKRGMNVQQIEKGLRNFSMMTWGVSINTQREYAKTAIFMACKNSLDAMKFQDEKHFNELIYDYAKQVLAMPELLEQSDAGKLNFPAIQ